MNKKIDSAINENSINTELEVIELDESLLESAAGAGGDGDNNSTNGVGGLVGIGLCDVNIGVIAGFSCNES